MPTRPYQASLASPTGLRREPRDRQESSFHGSGSPILSQGASPQQSTILQPPLVGAQKRLMGGSLAPIRSSTHHFAPHGGVVIPYPPSHIGEDSTTTASYNAFYNGSVTSGGTSPHRQPSTPRTTLAQYQRAAAAAAHLSSLNLGQHNSTIGQTGQTQGFSLPGPLSLTLAPGDPHVTHIRPAFVINALLDSPLRAGVAAPPPTPIAALNTALAAGLPGLPGPPKRLRSVNARASDPGGCGGAGGVSSGGAHRARSPHPAVTRLHLRGSASGGTSGPGNEGRWWSGHTPQPLLHGSLQARSSAPGAASGAVSSRGGMVGPSVGASGVAAAGAINNMLMGSERGSAGSAPPGGGGGGGGTYTCSGGSAASGAVNVAGGGGGGGGGSVIGATAVIVSQTLHQPHEGLMGSQGGVLGGCGGGGAGGCGAVGAKAAGVASGSGDGGGAHTQGSWLLACLCFRPQSAGRLERSSGRHEDSSSLPVQRKEAHTRRRYPTRGLSHALSDTFMVRSDRLAGITAGNTPVRAPSGGTTGGNRIGRRFQPSLTMQPQKSILKSGGMRRAESTKEPLHVTVTSAGGHHGIHVGGAAAPPAVPDYAAVAAAGCPAAHASTDDQRAQPARPHTPHPYPQPVQPYVQAGSQQTVLGKVRRLSRTLPGPLDSWDHAIQGMPGSGRSAAAAAALATSIGDHRREELRKGAAGAVCDALPAVEAAAGLVNGRAMKATGRGGDRAGDKERTYGVPSSRRWMRCEAQIRRGSTGTLEGPRGHMFQHAPPIGAASACGCSAEHVRASHIEVASQGAKARLAAAKGGGAAAPASASASGWLMELQTHGSTGDGGGAAAPAAAAASNGIAGGAEAAGIVDPDAASMAARASKTESLRRNLPRLALPTGTGSESSGPYDDLVLPCPIVSPAALGEVTTAAALCTSGGGSSRNNGIGSGSIDGGRTSLMQRIASRQRSHNASGSGSGLPTPGSSGGAAPSLGRALSRNAILPLPNPRSSFPGYAAAAADQSDNSSNLPGSLDAPLAVSTPPPLVSTTRSFGAKAAAAVAAAAAAVTDFMAADSPRGFAPHKIRPTSARHLSVRRHEPEACRDSLLTRRDSSEDGRDEVHNVSTKKPLFTDRKTAPPGHMRDLVAKLHGNTAAAAAALDGHSSVASDQPQAAPRLRRLTTGGLNPPPPPVQEEAVHGSRRRRTHVHYQTAGPDGKLRAYTSSHRLMDSHLSGGLDDQGDGDDGKNGGGGVDATRGGGDDGRSNPSKSAAHIFSVHPEESLDIRRLSTIARQRLLDAAAAAAAVAASAADDNKPAAASRFEDRRHHRRRCCTGEGEEEADAAYEYAAFRAAAGLGRLHGVSREDSGCTSDADAEEFVCSQLDIQRLPGMSERTMKGWPSHNSGRSVVPASIKGTRKSAPEEYLTLEEAETDADAETTSAKSQQRRTAPSAVPAATLAWGVAGPSVDHVLVEAWTSSRLHPAPSADMNRDIARKSGSGSGGGLYGRHHDNSRRLLEGLASLPHSPWRYDALGCAEVGAVSDAASHVGQNLSSMPSPFSRAASAMIAAAATAAALEGAASTSASAATEDDGLEAGLVAEGRDSYNEGEGPGRMRSTSRSLLHQQAQLPLLRRIFRDNGRRRVKCDGDGGGGGGVVDAAWCIDGCLEDEGPVRSEVYFAGSSVSSGVNSVAQLMSFRATQPFTEGHLAHFGAPGGGAAAASEHEYEEFRTGGSMVGRVRTGTGDGGVAALNRRSVTFHHRRTDSISVSNLNSSSVTSTASSSPPGWQEADLYHVRRMLASELLRVRRTSGIVQGPILESVETEAEVAAEEAEAEAEPSASAVPEAFGGGCSRGGGGGMRHPHRGEATANLPGGLEQQEEEREHAAGGSAGAGGQRPATLLGVEGGGGAGAEAGTAAGPQPHPPWLRRTETTQRGKLGHGGDEGSSLLGFSRLARSAHAIADCCPSSTIEAGAPSTPPPLRRQPSQPRQTPPAQPLLPVPNHAGRLSVAKAAAAAVPAVAAMHARLTAAANASAAAVGGAFRKVPPPSLLLATASQPSSHMSKSVSMDSLVLAPGIVAASTAVCASMQRTDSLENWVRDHSRGCTAVADPSQPLAPLDPLDELTAIVVGKAGGAGDGYTAAFVPPVKATAGARKAAAAAVAAMPSPTSFAEPAPAAMPYWHGKAHHRCSAGGARKLPEPAAAVQGWLHFNARARTSLEEQRRPSAAPAGGGGGGADPLVQRLSLPGNLRLGVDSSNPLHGKQQ
ncbi:hypothetical protein Agub_g12818 [Astrephomene gubernaculifera]|uniref:Uncharacterized protein n=1 Tax=Astrephomene gubernaculifera TaxID=47775 RepID=A0AAD3E0R9_9CHLO|nr:hypothetical protein Agub_g12818 [Astrephomene gubernaculifera]